VRTLIKRNPAAMAAKTADVAKAEQAAQ